MNRHPLVPALVLLLSLLAAAPGFADGPNLPSNPDFDNTAAFATCL